VASAAVLRRVGGQQRPRTSDARGSGRITAIGTSSNTTLLRRQPIAVRRIQRPVLGRRRSLVPDRARRHTRAVVLADGVAVVHGLAVLFMLTGALLAVRWPRLVLLHAPVALAILAVNLAGADCPLTYLELALRGAEAYDGGFLGHYFFAPLGLDERAAGTQLGMYGTAIGLNALGYGLLGARYWAVPRAPEGLQDRTSRRNPPAAG
jgi:hypothetical protein